MARKGQKFQKYSEELKAKVLRAYFEGVSVSHLAQEFDIPRGTIGTWTYQANHPRQKGKRGRPKQAIDYKERYEILKKFQAFLKEHDKKR